MISFWFSPDKLHLPDGFLSTPVALVGWGLAVFIVSFAIRRTRDELGERQIPFMGVLAAFIFAAQAINFPVAAGTSGHLLGGALAAIVMGPWVATLIMTAVITVQALLFQDGGLVVMGWNVINMGVLTAFAGYAAYSFMLRLIGETSRARLAAGFAAAWVSVEIGAIATAIELAISGTSVLDLALPAMAGVHALIGVGEGLITVGAITILQITRPHIIQSGRGASGGRSAIVVLLGLCAALLVASFSPWGSASPDGLEFVAQNQTFMESAVESSFQLLPDYTLPVLQVPTLATMLAVGLGTIIVFIVAWVVGRASSRPFRE